MKQGRGSLRVVAFCSLTTNGVSYGEPGTGWISKTDVFTVDLASYNIYSKENITEISQLLM